MTYTITHNSAFGSLEIRFSDMPTPAVRSALKNFRFRWHSLGRYWFGRADENAVRSQLDKLLARAEKIAAANRKTDREPLAPRPKYTPAPDFELVEVSEAPDPAPAVKPIPATEDLPAVRFSYHTGNTIGKAALTASFLSSATGSTLRIIRDMMDGIEDTEERENAFFTLAAVAWNNAAEDPTKMPRFRELAALYQEKTGNVFPAPSEERPAAAKTVSTAMKRVYRTADDNMRGVLTCENWKITTDFFHAVYLRSASPDLPAADLSEERADQQTEILLKVLNKAEEEPREAVVLPTIRELKAWLKTSDDARKPYYRYRLADGIDVNGQKLLNILEALPGCSAFRASESIFSPILFKSGEDRGILMPLKPKTEDAAA